MTKPISTGIVGAGFSARIFHAPFITSSPSFSLSLFLRSSNRASVQGFESVPVTNSLQEFLDSPISLAVVTTPSHLHYDLVNSLLLHGKHVLVEKPITVTASEAESLFKTAKQNSVILAVYQNRTYDADFQLVSEIIKSGKLGRVVEFTSSFDRYRPKIKSAQAWRELDVPGNGVLYDLGSHTIHQAIHLFGKPISVHGVVDNLRILEETNACDFFSVTLYYEKLVVVCKATMLSCIPACRFVVHGTLGSAEVTGLDGELLLFIAAQEGQLVKGMKPSDEGFGIGGLQRARFVGPDGHEELLDLGRGRYLDLFENLAQAIRSGNQNLLDVKTDDAILAIQIIEAAIKSAKLKQVVLL